MKKRILFCLSLLSLVAQIKAMDNTGRLRQRQNNPNYHPPQNIQRDLLDFLPFERQEETCHDLALLCCFGTLAAGIGATLKLTEIGLEYYKNKDA